MAATKDNPIYTVYIVSGSTKYDVSGCVESISFSEGKKQFSKSVEITLANAQAGSVRLSGIFKVRDRVFIYADDGEKKDEVWRGFIWTRPYKSSADERKLSLKGYDNLIYFQESEESEFFSSGKSTKDIMISLCTKWGVSLDYSYESITHSKLALRGALSDIITSDILDLVKDRTGKKYTILSDKDVMWVKQVGQNSTVYKIEAGKNAIRTTSSCTMDGMITKVIILGKADKQDRRPVEATVEGETSKYGTLQKIITRDENTTLADSKKEGDSIIKEDGKPKWEYEVEAPDIPWIRKGDKVDVRAGDLTGFFIVTGIDRDIKNTKKTMILTMEDE